MLRVLFGAVAQRFSLFFHVLRFQTQLLGTFTLIFHFAAALLQAGDDLLKHSAFIGNELLCVLYDVRRHTETCGNGKCVGTARYADEQAIRRAQRRHVKFAAGVFNANGLNGICLQFCVMRCRHYARAFGAHGFDDGNSKRGALDWVGARTELID